MYWQARLHVLLSSNNSLVNFIPQILVVSVRINYFGCVWIVHEILYSGNVSYIDS
jgi:hypothetical protein